MNNGTLYTTMDGIEKAFNVSFKYDVSKKKVTIQTMENKLETYKNSILDFGLVMFQVNLMIQKLY